MHYASIGILGRVILYDEKVMNSCLWGKGRSLSSAAAEMMKRQVEEVREAEEKDEEKPEMSEDEREKYYRRRRGLGIGYLPGHGFYISSHAPRSLTVPVIFLLALVLVFYFGLTIDLFIMIFVIVGIVCLGKVGDL
jgi:hypothetical protein